MNAAQTTTQGNTNAASPSIECRRREKRGLFDGSVRAKQSSFHTNSELNQERIPKCTYLCSARDDPVNTGVAQAGSEVGPGLGGLRDCPFKMQDKVKGEDEIRASEVITNTRHSK